MRVVALSVLQILAAGLLARAAPIVGMHLAGQLWDELQLSAPYLSQAGTLAAGVLGGALVGAAQWAALRVRGRWIVYPMAGGLFIVAAGLAWPPLALLAAPVAGGLAGVLQQPLLRAAGYTAQPRAGLAWPKAQALAGAMVAMALLLPFPRWAAAAFVVSASLVTAAAVRPAQRDR